jgi:undecaprenyl-diphosphatase
VFELLEAVFLGVVQGLTEFLPVSSSGHLLFSQYFLGMDQERFGLSFDAAIHTGTLLAAVLFFRGDLLAMARAFLGSLPHPDFADAQVRTAYLILLATVPGALIGFFFEDFFATEVRSPWVVVINLVFVGVLFLVAEAVGRKTESAIKLGPLGALGIGLAQAAALVPGVSRSGATITFGLFLGLAEAVGEGMGSHEAAMFLVGSVSSGVVGYLAIRFLLGFLANHSLRVFAYYRFALATVVAVVLLTSSS